MAIPIRSFVHLTGSCFLKVAALRYFGNVDVVGKAISMRIMNTPYIFTVEGVFRDFPKQSHFHANYILSMEYFRKIEGNDMFTNWGANSVFTYILLKKPGTMNAMTGRMQGFINKYVPKDNAKNLKYELQPLLRIHLNYEKVEADIETQGSITRVTSFTSIAILVLIIAVVNFLLLSLALSYDQRIREFGIRTIAGAKRRDLVSLVSAEFLIVFVVAAQIALMLVGTRYPLTGIADEFQGVPWRFFRCPAAYPFYGTGFSYRLHGQRLYCIKCISVKAGGGPDLKRGNSDANAWCPCLIFQFAS